MKKLCFVCNDAAVEADTEFEGKPVHSWHLSEFQRTAMSSRVIEREENEMAAKIEIDNEKLKAMHGAGATDSTIAQQFGCSAGTIWTRRKALGLPAVGVGGWNAHKANRSDPVHKARRNAAIVKAPAEPVIPSGAKDPALPKTEPNGSGHSRCRVAMFEIEGDERAVLAAVEAVKVALLRAAQ